MLIRTAKAANFTVFYGWVEQKMGVQDLLFEANGVFSPNTMKKDAIFYMNVDINSAHAVLFLKHSISLFV
jgi:hypothetical protein